MFRFSNECLAPTAAIALLTGAGEGSGRVLGNSGIEHAIIAETLPSHIQLLLAALMRLAVGSATVAMSTAASIVAPIALYGSGADPASLAIATGAGSLIFSHVNDGSFRFVKEYFNMGVRDTLKLRSICESIISVCAPGLIFAAFLSVR